MKKEIKEKIIEIVRSPKFTNCYLSEICANLVADQILELFASKNQPENQDWEKEFEEKILYPSKKCWGIYPEQIIAIKSFIRNLIASEKEKGIQEGYERGRIKCLDTKFSDIDFKETRESIIKEARQEERERIADEVAKLGGYTEDPRKADNPKPNVWYNQAIRDVLEIIKGRQKIN